MHEQLTPIFDALADNDWFAEPGAYVLVDGQYGSTGKGAVASLLAHLFSGSVDVVTTNAGPNSGHTGFYAKDEKMPWQKVVTQQIPVFAVVARELGMIKPVAYLNGGAVLDPNILREEAKLHRFNRSFLKLHPNAAVIDYDHQHDDADSTAAIASTNKGVGRAIARKVMREDNVVKKRLQDFAYFSAVTLPLWDWTKQVVFVETAQGFSLGINQGFYPYTTSRECTVGQALADAAIPYNKVRKVIMTVRTFPIRVGNTKDGHSGDCYGDQKETTWEALGVEPEMTTVTKRVRRVFTWSDNQFMDAVEVNQPDMIVVNFLDYMRDASKREIFLDHVMEMYEKIMGRKPDVLLGGYGPLPTDMRIER